MRMFEAIDVPELRGHKNIVSKILIDIATSRQWY